MSAARAAMLANVGRAVTAAKATTKEMAATELPSQLALKVLYSGGRQHITAVAVVLL